ncbi:unnamed protein product, partial [Anisakis simplex]|uniref:HSF_DOMAIN domain-containing protein n=1 Tax=Anisakis simplex TaxID=6269 RepID=A0A0M3J039_ANISI
IQNGVIVRNVRQSPSYFTVNEPNLSFSDYQPDYTLLQYILFQGYKMSIRYDRLNHNNSMSKIKERISKVLLPNLGNDSSRTTLSSSSSIVKSINPQMITSKFGNPSKIGDAMRLSRSMNNIAAGSAASIAIDHKSADRSRRNKTNDIHHKYRTKHPPKPTKTMNQHSFENHLQAQDSSARCVSAELRRSSSSDINNFHTTQYLIFPIADKTKAPVLIHFPEDVIDNDENPIDDHWGSSDTSLEEEAEMASQIKGDIEITYENNDDDVIAADGLHAPFNDHL